MHPHSVGAEWVTPGLRGCAQAASEGPGKYALPRRLNTAFTSQQMFVVKHVFKVSSKGRVESFSVAVLT